MNGYIVCFVTCWACKFDHHNPEPHPWWDSEDVEYAEMAGTELPSGYCGCYCCKDKVKELEEAENETV